MVEILNPRASSLLESYSSILILHSVQLKMARTRSSASSAGKAKADHHVEDVAIPANLPSFNGSLTQFGFASTDNTDAGITNETSSEKSTVTRKRKAESRTTASTSKKQKSLGSKYADPSKYAHLNGIPDAIAPNLLCLLVGHNPGVKTAVSGHACK
jgi:thymine-DNA glycosylase